MNMLVRVTPPQSPRSGSTPPQSPRNLVTGDGRQETHEEIPAPTDFGVSGRPSEAPVFDATTFGGSIFCCAVPRDEDTEKESKAKKIAAPASVQTLGERPVANPLAGRQERLPGFPSTFDFAGLQSLPIAATTVREPGSPGSLSRTISDTVKTMPVEKGNPTTPMERFSMHQPDHPLEGRPGDSTIPIDEPNEKVREADPAESPVPPKKKGGLGEELGVATREIVSLEDPTANAAPHGQVSKKAKEQVEKAIKFFESQDADGTRRKIFQSNSPRIDAHQLAEAGVGQNFDSAIVVTPSVGQPLSNQDLANMLDQKYGPFAGLKTALVNHFNEQSDGIKAMVEELSATKRDKAAVLASLNKGIKNERESLDGITSASELVAYLNNLRSKCSKIIHQNTTVPYVIYRRMKDIKKEQRKIGPIRKLLGFCFWSDPKTKERKIKIDNCEIAIREAKNGLSYSITLDSLLDLGEKYRFPSKLANSDKASVQTLMLTVPSLAAEQSVVDLSAVQNLENPAVERNHYADGVRFALKYGKTGPLKDMLTTIYRGLLDKLDGKSTLVVLEPMDLQQLGIDNNLLKKVGREALKKVGREALEEVLKDRPNVNVIINGPEEATEAAAPEAAPQEGPAA